MIIFFYAQVIKELLQSARAGKPIDENEIPPAIGTIAISSSQPTIVPQQVPVRAPSPPPQRPSVASLPINDKPVVSARKLDLLDYN